jgi:hypothetical protein
LPYLSFNSSRKREKSKRIQSESLERFAG